MLAFDVRRHLRRAFGLPLTEGFHIPRFAHDIGRHSLVDPPVDLLAVGRLVGLEPLEGPLVGNRHSEVLFALLDIVRPNY